MPKTEPEIYISDLSHDGRGVGRVGADESGKGGKACFVSGALPTETVRWKKTNSKRSFDEGELVSVIEASADRIRPRCAYFDDCGGCELQHLNSAAQLGWKEHQLKSAFSRASIEPINWLPPLASESWAYRRRSRLAVSYEGKGQKGQKDKAVIGFRKKSSRQLVKIDRCDVLDERLNEVIPLLGEIAKKLRKYGLTEIELSVADESAADKSAADQEIAFCFSVKKIIDGLEFNKLELNDLKKVGPNIQFWQRLPSCDAQPLGDYSPLLSQLTDKTRMEFVPGQFVQVNSEMNRAMINQALQLTKPDSNTRVLDLFCGAGNFSLAFAERSKHVLGVEGYAGLCQQAERNATQMEYSNIDFRVVDLGKAEQFSKIASGEVDLVILDPPRAGAANLTGWLNRLSAPKILYISCHPATMVRDMQALMPAYRLESVGVMDMFPHTAHVEAMGLLVRNK